MDEYIRNKKRSKKATKRRSSAFSKYISKFLLLVVLTLSILIALKGNTKFRTLFYKEVYDTHFSFASINKLYQDTFGNPIPFKDLFEKDVRPVFNDKLTYKKASKYYDGVSLEVDKNLLVPILESGMVVFIGKKDNYGSTVIIEQIDGVDAWYGNVTNLNVKLYDYVDKGKILGNVVDSNLYLVYKKDGKNIDYEEYL